MKLNGWKRIGIVASMLWAIGAYIHTFDDREKGDMTIANAITESCVEANGGKELGDNECLKQGERYAIRSFPSERNEAAFAALAPIPLGWGFAYLVLFTIRWIRRGFVRTGPKAAE